MIACNACQLLATNLPVCHSCVFAPFLGPLRPLLILLIFILSAMVVQVGVKSTLQQPTWPPLEVSDMQIVLQFTEYSWLRLICIGLNFYSIYGPTWAQKQVKSRGVAFVIGHLELIFGLCWVSWCHHRGLDLFLCWDGVNFLILTYFWIPACDI